MNVIEYLIDQVNLNDIRNLQYEEDTIFLITRKKESYHRHLVSSVSEDIISVYKLQQLMSILEKYRRDFISFYEYTMKDRYENYYDTAYEQTSDLINLGNEVYGNLTKNVKEMQGEYGDEYIKFIRDHSFDMLSSYSYDQINKIRSKLGDMLLKGTASKVNVRNMIQKTLDTNQSKAEEITQTELSRAYNYGTLARLKDYEKESGNKVRKYWYGFKYSANTCEDCRPHIGEIYDLDDDMFTLPLHVRCRCVWLPVLNGWDKPIIKDLTSRANMLNTAYSADMIYNRINSRLNINYGDYIDDEAAYNYIAGDRSEGTLFAISSARSEYIDDVIKKFDIALDTSNTHMASEFNIQMKFWQKLTGGAIADNDKDLLNRSYEAIKAITILPWNSTQMIKWESLLSSINLYK